MPIYEYLCGNCGKTSEIMQKFSDPPASQCPECAGPVTKQMSLSAFALKGSGFYTTDYRRAGSKPCEKAESAGKTSDGKAPSSAGAESAGCDAPACGQGACAQAVETP